MSTLSREEEARALSLADTALHNEAGLEGTEDQAAGDRARLDHLNLKEQLKDAVDQFEQDAKAEQETKRKAS